MFKFFKKKSELQKLEEVYAKLLEESFNLSKTDRKASDDKQYEAEQIMKKIEKIKAQQ